MRSLWKCIDREEALGQSPGTLQCWGVGEVREESARRLLAAREIGREKTQSMVTGSWMKLCKEEG